MTKLLLSLALSVVAVLTLNYQQGGTAQVGGGGGTSPGGPATIDATNSAYAGGVKASGHFGCEANTTNGNTTITTGNDDPPFTVTATDPVVGDIIFVTSTPCAGVFGTSSTLALAQTTILSRTDAHHVVVNGAGATATVGNAACCSITWGPVDDGPALQAAFVAATTDGVCGTLRLPAGGILLGRPIGNNASHCGSVGSFTIAEQGYTVAGQGQGSTILLPLPGFDANLAVNNTYLFGVPATAGIQNTTIKDIGINGSGFMALLNGASAQNIFNLGTSVAAGQTIENVTCINWATGVAGIRPLSIGGIQNGEAFAKNVIFYTCGNTGPFITGTATLINVAVFNPGTTSLSTGAGSSIYTYGCQFVSTFLSVDAVSVPANGATIYDFGSIFSAIGGGTSTAFNARSLVYLDGTTISGGLNGLSMNQGGTSAQVHARGTIFSGGTNAITGGVAGSKFFDEGGNQFTGAIVPTNISFFGNLSITGTAFTTSSFALTSGWGASTKASAAGDSQSFNFVITGAAGAAGPVVTVTFPTTFLVAPSQCTIQQTSGTFGVLTNPAIGALTTTGFTITWAGTPAANTYGFSGSCR